MEKLLVNTAVLVLVILGYLQPFHSIPWMSALNSGVFLVLGLFLAAVGLLMRCNRTVQFAWVEIVLLSLVLVHGMATHNVTQKSVLPVIIVLGITYLCVKLPIRSMDIGGVLMLGIFVAGIISALFGIGLWLGAAQQYDTYQVWMAHTEPNSRLISNLAQPNHAGTLFLWTLAVAAFYAHQVERNLNIFSWQKQAVQGALLACSILIATAVALTLSRTAMLNILLIMAGTVFFRRQLGGKAVRLVVVSFVSAVLLTVLLPDIKQHLFGFGETYEVRLTSVLGGRGMGDNARMVANLTFVEALKAHWLMGYGIGGITNAYLEHLNSQPPLGVYFGEAHNLPLEILVSLGIPLGGVVIIFLGRVIFRAIKNVHSVRDGAMLSMVLMVLVHSMLEYPLHYAYFLIPTAFFISLLQPERNRRAVKIAWHWIGIAWLALVTLFIVVAENYFTVEQDIRSAKVEAAITGKPKPASAEYSNMIWELEALNIALRTDIASNISPAELDAYARVIHVYPTHKFLQNYIAMLLANGKTAEAAVWSRCSLLLYGDAVPIKKKLHDDLEINHTGEEI